MLATLHSQQVVQLHLDPSSVGLQGKREFIQSREPPLAMACPPHPPSGSFPYKPHGTGVGKIQGGSWEPSVPMAMENPEVPA